ncbi:YdeI/OmpD-associated family protein [Parahaliea mediterranea]|uniref:YdeI/OmpD-associated family protein n=1 Tax=Parahaliea mediterranea TaxID=651086 RepID=A0A939DDZ0_9GAMM|nr:YdeI/OmpD-associated family protein [Parahaliea mediterranea]MBN7796478.1 YdeI/OmpD-associated family protein [Parahaliea mediterranea]
MSATDTKVQALIDKAQWREERKKLRALLLDSQLEESVKWGKLCYSLNGANVAVIFGMKHYCAIGFFKGSLIDDAQALLVSPGENSQAMRQIRFTALADIDAQEGVIRDYIRRAIDVEKAGLQVDFKAKRELVAPEELQRKLDDEPTLKAAFAALTPGRQRAYILHFSAAKQARTRASRVEKCIPHILAGKGLNDR